MRVIWLFITIFTFNDPIEFYVPIAQTELKSKKEEENWKLLQMEMNELEIPWIACGAVK